MDILLNVDQLTNYRKTQIKTFIKCAKNHKMVLKILANTKKTKNLPVLKQYIHKDNLIKSEPIYFLNYCIWQPGLIFNIFNKKPKLAIIWGEVTRLNSWVILILKRLNLINTEIILWTHGIYGRENYFLKNLRLLYLHLSDFLLVYSSYSKNLLIRNGINREKIFVIGNSIERESEYSLKTNLQKNSKNLNLLFVGRKSKRKKLFLIEEIIRDWDEEFFLTFTCIGPDIKFFKEYNFKKSKLILVPAIYDPKVLQNYINSSDYGVCPDHIGLFCITCINSGLPIISHNNYSLHGPEGHTLIPEKNLINIKFPINLYNLKKSIIKAYSQKELFSQRPLEISQTLNDEFKTKYVNKSIKNFMDTRFAANKKL